MNASSTARGVPMSLAVPAITATLIVSHVLIALGAAGFQSNQDTYGALAVHCRISPNTDRADVTRRLSAFARNRDKQAAGEEQQWRKAYRRAEDNRLKAADALKAVYQRESDAQSVAWETVAREREMLQGMQGSDAVSFRASRILFDRYTAPEATQASRRPSGDKEAGLRLERARNDKAPRELIVAISREVEAYSDAAFAEERARKSLDFYLAAFSCPSLEASRESRERSVVEERQFFIDRAARLERDTARAAEVLVLAGGALLAAAIVAAAAPNASPLSRDVVDRIRAYNSQLEFQCLTRGWHFLHGSDATLASCIPR